MSVSVTRTIYVDGIAIQVEEIGAGRPVVLLHGFTGSASSMAAIAKGLSDSYRTLSLDLIGHGRSDAPPDPAAYSMPRCVGQVASVLDELDVRDAHLIGYSMGGRVGLALCAAQAKRIASALLIGARPGFADREARAARIRDDEALAERILREGIPAFVDYWMAQPFQPKAWRIGTDAHAALRQGKLANRAHALAASLRGMGAGAQPPLHDQLASIKLPICLVVGAEDEVFRAVAEELARALPHACIASVPDSHHAAHIENPSVFLEVARRFFGEVDARNNPLRLPTR